MPPERRAFPPVSACDPSGRDSHAVAADLDGTLLVSRSSFPYFMLLAVEAGSFPRGLALLLASPLVLFLYKLVSEAAGIQLLIFVSLTGLPMRSIERVSATVLPKFYAADVREESWRAFRACGRRRVVVTANPSVMVEAFVRECLGGDVVLGTELAVWRGRATGLVRGPGVLVGTRKREALVREFRGKVMPEMGLGDRESDHDFMTLCKEGYMVPPNPSAPRPHLHLLLPPSATTSHYGLLALRPTPLASLCTFLWLPLAFLLSSLRLTLLHLSPSPLLLRLALLRITTRGTTPPYPSLLICNKRRLSPLHTLLLSAALHRRVRSLQLRGNPTADAATIQELLKDGDVAVCPESATWDETLLLLPGEMKKRVMPAGMRTTGETVFAAGSGGSGWKEGMLWMMNPRPECEVKFFDGKEEVER